MKKINLFISIPCTVAVVVMAIAAVGSFRYEDKMVEWVVASSALVIVLYTLFDFPITRIKIVAQLIPFSIVAIVFNPFFDLVYHNTNLNEEAQGYSFIVVFFFMLIGVFNDAGTYIEEA